MSAPKTRRKTAKKRTRSTEHRVEVRNNRYVDATSNSPETTIEVGDSVRWVQLQGNHTMVSDNRAPFDSLIPPFQDDSIPSAGLLREFNSPGKYGYHCGIHGGDPERKRGMWGTVTVITRSASIVRSRPSATDASSVQRYVSAVQTLINAPLNPYGSLVAHHADMSHNMHGMNPVGRQRFLPWHRLYLVKFEEMLLQIDASVTIPYWDWTQQRSVPLGINNFKPRVSVPGVGVVNVSRRPGSSNSLPTAASLGRIMSANDYGVFTQRLEDGPHNFVHNWCSGTMSNIRISPADPLFWLHHAQIDRLWHQWQAAHPNKNPLLNGGDAILDPWSEAENEVRSIEAQLGYTYG